jgi:hypothetical protein
MTWSWFQLALAVWGLISAGLLIWTLASVLVGHVVDKASDWL